MADLSTQLSQALADATALRDEFNTAIDQMQDFFTSTNNTVTFTKPDGTDVTLDSLDKLQSDFDSWQASAIEEYSPVIHASQAVTNFPSLVETFYVTPTDPGASDSNPGTQAEPFATLDHAVTVARRDRQTTIILETGQTYTMSGSLAVTKHLTITQSSAATADRDSTVIDFSSVVKNNINGGGILSYGGGNVNLTNITIKGPQETEDGNSNVYVAPCILALSGGYFECSNVRLLPSDSADTFGGAPNTHAEGAVEVRWGSIVLQNGCKIDMSFGASLRANGIVFRQGGYALMVSTEFANCQVAVTDQHVSRPGGFAGDGGGITYTNVGANTDFDSLGNKLIVENFT